MALWFCRLRTPPRVSDSRGQDGCCLPRSSVWTLLPNWKVVALWTWDCQPIPFRRSRLGTNFHSLHSSFLSIKKACCCVPRTLSDPHSERIGLDLWAQATPSVSIREVQKKWCGSITQLYFLQKGKGIKTANQSQNSDSWLEIWAGDKVLDLVLSFSSLRIGLPCGVKSPLI